MAISAAVWAIHEGARSNGCSVENLVEELVEKTLPGRPCHA
jgi:hypothetical protein